MTKKIFIDTNKYLDFYRYKNENLEILNKLQNCKDIILVEQVVDEFKRNRNKEIVNLINKVKEVSSRINNNTLNIEPFGIYNEQIKQINNLSTKNIQEIKDNISNFQSTLENTLLTDETDIVYTTFKKIISNSTLYKHDMESYNKAIIRNNLGGIPRSDRMGFRNLTICDEYIWETILKNSKNDICFITRDKTYLENINILTEEYKNKTKKDIKFVENISEGLEFLGDNISTYAKELEQINSLELKYLQEELLDENNDEKLDFNQKQKDILNLAMNLAIKAKNSNKKKVLIVSGETGTGKTFLATNLLVNFVQNDFITTFITKSSSSRKIFYDKLKGKCQQKYLNNLFKSSGSFTDSISNQYDCLIVDDSHRLQLKSGLFHNIGENQVKEIINASKLSVFFIDEKQRITLEDIGTIENIKMCAKELSADIEMVELTNQYRCNFNSTYLKWIDNVLEINKMKFEPEKIYYDFKVLDNPNDLRKLIEEKNKINNKSRIVAGYCWDWKSESKKNNNIYDIVIPEYDFKMSWNLDNEKSWATDRESINEVGSIYTCQGLEFDYVGVIIGDDLRYENNKIITDYKKRAKTDASLRGINKKIMSDEEGTLKLVDYMIKNTYRILMTRGRKGCYIYCTDKNLSKYLKTKINDFTNL